MKKEEVFDQLATKGLQYLENFEQFAKTEIPDYFQQILTYNLNVSFFWLGVFGLIILLGCLLMYVSKDSGDGMGFGVIIIMIFVLLSGFQIRDIVKIKYAPKVFLVDYLRGEK
jgi:formate-dependent nitrite reductase membrane component NrfD